MVAGTVLLEEAYHLADTVQRRVEVGARLTPVACGADKYKRLIDNSINR